MRPTDLLTQWKGLHARSIAEAYNELVRPTPDMQAPEWVDKLYLVRLLSETTRQPADWDGILRRATEIQKQRDERLAETKKAWAHAAQRKIACAKLQQEYNALPYFGFEVKVVDPHAVVLTMSHRQLWDMAAELLDVNKRLNNTAVYHLRATSAWVTIEMPKTAFDELIPRLGARDVPLGSN